MFFTVINRVGRGVSHGDYSGGAGAGSGSARKLTTLNFNSRGGVNPSTGITVETSTELHALESFPVGVRMRPDGTVLTEKTSMTSFLDTDKPRRSFAGAEAV